MEPQVPKFAVGCVVENRIKPGKWIVIGHQLRRDGRIMTKTRAVSGQHPNNLSALETYFELAP